MLEFVFEHCAASEGEQLESERETTNNEPYKHDHERKRNETK